MHCIFSHHTGAWRFPSLADFLSIDIHSDSFRIYVGVFGLLGACGALAGGIVRRGSQLKSGLRNEHLFEKRIDEQLLPPLLIPSRTAHSRVFPKKHSFSYSYLFVGIPVGVSGRVSAALSIDCDTHSWFHVDSANYLLRDQTEQGLGHKLKQYLHTQGVTDRDYAFAYLVTAPEFSGYSFNPASFWYIYDSDAALKYMIVEVNNTFDERRMYLLRADKTASENDSEDEYVGSQTKTMFTNTWQKDFHVSPFNSTRGSYSLKAVDPLAALQDTGRVTIDNTIILRSSKDEAKIVARVRSEGQPQDVTSISFVTLLRFIASWFWVGFATFPRILWEANKLFFRRDLHVWYRPEVVETSLGRTYTADELDLERFFAAFLEDIVSSAQRPLRVIYEAAHAGGQETVMYSPGFTYEEDHRSTLTIKVLSPAFYSRLVHYAHIKEAFDRECLATDEKNQTLVIQSAKLLPVFFEAMSARQTTWTVKSHRMLVRDRWRWLQKFRCPPPAQSYGSASSSASEYTVSDIRSFKESEMDRFVRSRSENVARYQKISIKLFLAQRFAFGIPALVVLVDWLWRALMLFMPIWRSEAASAIDVFRPRDFDSEDMAASLVLFLLANGVHAYSFSKS